MAIIVGRIVVNLNRNVCAGVDLGGTKIAIVLGSEKGSVLAETKIDTRPLEGPDQAFRRIVESLDRLSTDCGSCYEAIGLGVPGLTDPVEGTILFLPNLPSNWTGFPASEFLSSQTQKPAYLLNDARLAALGEFHFGSAIPSRNMLVVTVGTGIGGGLILDGKLRLGECGAAGEVGHHTVVPDGPPCSCGSCGCVEAFMNGPRLAALGTQLVRQGKAPRLQEIVAGKLESISPREMALAAESGDTAIASVIRECAVYLGIGIANAICITAVNEVVLCGGVATLGDLLLVPIREEIRKRVRMFPAERVTIRRSSLGERVGALGALALAFFPLFPRTQTPVI